MPAHGVVTARPKRGLHLAAGVAKACVLQHYTPDPERFAFQLSGYFFSVLKGRVELTVRG